MFYKVWHFFYRIRLNLRKIKAWFLLNKFNIALLDNVVVKFKAKNCIIGDSVIFYENCVLEIHTEAHFQVGNNCTFSYGVIISSFKQVIIGNHVMVGEYTSIRDTAHQYNIVDKPMMKGKDISKPIVIGNNVWIGRGCIIMPGTIIEDGVVVAANSVVKGLLKSNSIYGGTPSRYIKSRI